jgi:hypothetical protein
MSHKVTLTVTSLLSMLLFTFHVADDISRGFEKGGLSTLVVVPIVLVWLCGALVLAERRSGYVIMLVLSLLVLVVPVIHMKGKGIGEIAESAGGFFFAWTLIAIGVTGLFSAVLSVLGLWRSVSASRPRPAAP